MSAFTAHTPEWLTDEYILCGMDEWECKIGSHIQVFVQLATNCGLDLSKWETVNRSYKNSLGFWLKKSAENTAAMQELLQGRRAPKTMFKGTIEQKVAENRRWTLLRKEQERIKHFRDLYMDVLILIVRRIRSLKDELSAAAGVASLTNLDDPKYLEV